MNYYYLSQLWTKIGEPQDKTEKDFLELLKQGRKKAEIIEELKISNNVYVSIRTKLFNELKELLHSFGIVLNDLQNEDQAEYACKLINRSTCVDNKLAFVVYTDSSKNEDFFNYSASLESRFEEVRYIEIRILATGILKQDVSNGITEKDTYFSLIVANGFGTLPKIKRRLKDIGLIPEGTYFLEEELEEFNRYNLYGE